MSKYFGLLVDPNGIFFFLKLDFLESSFLKNFFLPLKFDFLDSSFIIHGISAAIWFSEDGIRDLDDCLNERKKVDQELVKLFKNLDREVSDNQIHSGDITGKSVTHNIRYWFKKGHNAGTSCYILSKEFGGTNHLKVMVNSNEFINWLNNVVYK